MGFTSRNQYQVETFLRSLQREHTPETYDMFHNNCNHFSERLVQYLLPGRSLPQYIIGLPDEVLQTFLGSLIKPIVDAATLHLKETIRETGDAAELNGELFFFGGSYSLLSGDSGDTSNESSVNHLLVEECSYSLYPESRRIYGSESETPTCEAEVTSTPKVILDQSFSAPVDCASAYHVVDSSCRNGNTDALAAYASESANMSGSVYGTHQCGGRTDMTRRGSCRTSHHFYTYEQIVCPTTSQTYGSSSVSTTSRHLSDTKIASVNMNLSADTSMDLSSSTRDRHSSYKVQLPGALRASIRLPDTSSRRPLPRHEKHSNSDLDSTDTVNQSVSHKHTLQRPTCSNYVIESRIPQETWKQEANRDSRLNIENSDTVPNSAARTCRERHSATRDRDSSSWRRHIQRYFSGNPSAQSGDQRSTVVNRVDSNELGASSSKAGDDQRMVQHMTVEAPSINGSLDKSRCKLAQKDHNRIPRLEQHIRADSPRRTTHDRGVRGASNTNTGACDLIWETDNSSTLSDNSSVFDSINDIIPSSSLDDFLIECSYEDSRTEFPSSHTASGGHVDDCLSHQCMDSSSQLLEIHTDSSEGNERQTEAKQKTTNRRRRYDAREICNEQGKVLPRHSESTNCGGKSKMRVGVEEEEDDYLNGLEEGDDFMWNLARHSERLCEMEQVK
eukprot:GHVQ01022548.1.p1 GENE.GHVQ01022548.1~~GHVQ01022548.1.p1  ORF type:complete len:674 (+),score=70.99 GHVQ01022548.1:287-2308(+)